MPKPQIIIGGLEGRHNETDETDETAKRLEKARAYEDLSTICVIPTRGQIAAPVVEAWMGLASPMNQKFVRIFVSGLEVGEAYSQAVEMILGHDDLKNWRYLLTLEEDNIPPPDGLLRLYESIAGFAAVGGLYWTKGEEGQPMIYGDPAEPINFRPIPPQPDTTQPCHGLGMGFTLFDLNIFRDGKLERPFFETVQRFDPVSGAAAYTQDLHFFERAGKAGYKFACDTRVRVGHYDAQQGICW